MKQQNRTQFLKKLALWVFGVSFVSVLYAQLNIPTDIDNSIQTIKRIVITDNGRADGNMIVGINVSGAQNTLQVSGSMMAWSISGLDANTVDGKYSSIVAGHSNTISSSAWNSSVVWGNNNIVSWQNSATVWWQDNIVGGNYSTAWGRRSQALHDYTWVWSDDDSTLYDSGNPDPIKDTFASKKSNTFLVRAKNGVGINNNDPQGALDVDGFDPQTWPTSGLTVAYDGKVGIATKTPSVPLEILNANPNTATLKLVQLASLWNYSDLAFQLASGSDKAYLRYFVASASEPNVLALWFGTTWQQAYLTVLANGRVGIGGILSPAETLDVNWTIKSTGLWSKGTGVQAIGLYTTAMGYGADALGDYSIAIGKATYAIGDTSMALWNDTHAFGVNSIAIWYWSESKWSNSVAIGNHTQALGVDSIALGKSTEANGSWSTAMGNTTYANGENSTAMWNTTSANGGNSTAMGYRTRANGSNSTAMGYISSALWENSTAMWAHTSANGSNSIAMWNATYANGTNSIAMWNITSAIWPNTTAMGNQTQANGNNSTSMGYRTRANGTNSTAMGYNSYALWENSTAMGVISNAYGWGSIAMGISTTASGLGSIALGYNTYASAGYSTAMGYRTQANGSNSTAMGYRTRANGSNSTAIGNNAIANGTNSIAMGNSAIANGDNSIAMGYNTYSAWFYSTTMGYRTQANGSSSTAMGYRTTANGSNSTAMGNGAQANGTNSTAMGYRTTANGSSSTALWSYNVGLSNAIFEVGIGTWQTTRANALTVLDNGAVYVDSISPGEDSCEYTIQNFNENFTMPLNGPYDGNGYHFTNYNRQLYYQGQVTVTDNSSNPLNNIWPYWSADNYSVLPNLWSDMWNNGYPFISHHSSSNACALSSQLFVDFYNWNTVNFYDNWWYSNFGPNYYQLIATSTANGCDYTLTYKTQSDSAIQPVIGSFTKEVSNYGNDPETVIVHITSINSNQGGYMYYYNGTYNGSKFDNLWNYSDRYYLFSENIWSTSPRTKKINKPCDTNVIWDFYWNDPYAYYNWTNWSASFQRFHIEGKTITTPNRSPSFSISPYGDIGIGLSTTWYTSPTLYRLEMIGNFKASGLVARGTGAVAAEHSTAMWYWSQANGSSSTAMGYKTQANGSGSTAMGVQTQANGQNSTTMGYRTQTNAPWAFAGWFYTKANGYDSFAFGNNTVTNGSNSFAIGYKTIAEGKWSFAGWLFTIANGYDSFAMGDHTRANTANSVALWYRSQANGSNAVAMWYRSQANGSSSTAMGTHTMANGSSSTAMGYRTTANGSNSTALWSYNLGLWNSVFEVGIWGVDELGQTVKKNALTILDNGAVYVDSKAPNEESCTYTITRPQEWNYIFDAPLDGPYSNDMFSYSNDDIASRSMYRNASLYLQDPNSNTLNSIWNLWWSYSEVFWNLWNNMWNSQLGAHIGGYTVSGKCQIGTQMLTSRSPWNAWSFRDDNHNLFSTNYYYLIANQNKWNNPSCDYTLVLYWQSSYFSIDSSNIEQWATSTVTVSSSDANAYPDQEVTLYVDSVDNTPYWQMYFEKWTYNGNPLTSIWHGRFQKYYNNLSDIVSYGWSKTVAGPCDANAMWDFYWNQPYAYYNGYNWQFYSDVYHVEGTSASTAKRSPSFSISPYGDVGIWLSTTWYESPALYKLEIIGNFKASGLIARGTGVVAAENATAMGYRSQANGSDSTAMWYKTQANGQWAFAGWFYSKANGYDSFAMGNNTQANGSNSTALWYKTEANGKWSLAVGIFSKANANDSTAMGYRTTANGSNSTAMGMYNEWLSNSLLEVGMGTSDTDRKNAFTVLDDGTVKVFKSIETPSLIVDKLINRTVTNITISGQLLPDVNAPVEYQTLGNETTPWKWLFLDWLSARGEWVSAWPQGTAMGYRTQANGSSSTAMGYKTQANGTWSLAGGYKTVAEGLDSIAMWSLSQAIGSHSFAMWYNSIARWNDSIALGNNTQANANYAVALWSATTANGQDSMAIWAATTAEKAGAFAGWLESIAYGYDSFAMWFGVLAKSDYSVAMGAWAQANGLISIALWFNTQANGENSLAAGVWSQANGSSSTALGNNTIASANYTTVIGKYNIPGLTSLFEVWMWTPNIRANALTVLANGNVGIGKAAPSEKLEVAGNVLATAYYYSSDIALKTDIKSLDNALDKINQLNGYSFSWKSDGRKDIWVIAQEVQKVFPELVHEDANGVKSVEYANLVAPIIEAIKELTHKIDDLFNKYISQEARITSLEQRLQLLEAHK